MRYSYPLLHSFLDAFSHLYKRVCPSVGPSVRHTRVEFRIFWLIWDKIALGTWCYATWRTLRLKLNKRASITWNYHFKDHLKTSTREDRQNASYVCTPSDLFLCNGFSRLPQVLRKDLPHLFFFLSQRYSFFLFCFVLFFCIQRFWKCYPMNMRRSFNDFPEYSVSEEWFVRYRKIIVL